MFCKPVFVYDQWLTRKTSKLKELFPYYSHRGEITYHQGTLLKKQRMIKPNTLACAVNYPSRTFWSWKFEKTCHSSPALSKKLIVIWKNRIEDIKKCPTCLTFCNQKTSELAVKCPVPQEPCSKLIWIVWILLFIGST